MRFEQGRRIWLTFVPIDFAIAHPQMVGSISRRRLVLTKFYGQRMRNTAQPDLTFRQHRQGASSLTTNDLETVAAPLFVCKTPAKSGSLGPLVVFLFDRTGGLIRPGVFSLQQQCVVVACGLVSSMWNFSCSESSAPTIA